VCVCVWKDVIRMQLYTDKLSWTHQILVHALIALRGWKQRLQCTSKKYTWHLCNQLVMHSRDYLKNMSTLTIYTSYIRTKLNTINLCGQCKVVHCVKVSIHKLSVYQSARQAY